MEASDSGLPIQSEYQDLELNLTQQFELNRLSRMIDSCNSVEKLRAVTHQLLKAWFVQKAAVNFVMQQKLIEFSPIPPANVDSQKQPDWA